MCGWMKPCRQIQAKEQAKQDAEKAELDKQTAQAQAEVDKVNAETAKQIGLPKPKALRKFRGLKQRQKRMQIG